MARTVELGNVPTDNHPAEQQLVRRTVPLTLVDNDNYEYYRQRLRLSNAANGNISTAVGSNQPNITTTSGYPEIVGISMVDIRDPANPPENYKVLLGLRDNSEIKIEAQSLPNYLFDQSVPLMERFYPVRLHADGAVINLIIETEVAISAADRVNVELILLHRRPKKC